MKIDKKVILLQELKNLTDFRKDKHKIEYPLHEIIFMSPFVIRVKSNTLIDEEYFGSRDLKELFSHTNKDEFYAFGKTKIFGTELDKGDLSIWIIDDFI